MHHIDLNTINKEEEAIKGQTASSTAPGAEFNPISRDIPANRMADQNGWFAVPRALIDLFLPHLKDTELRVLLVVLRATRGWQARRESGEANRSGSKTGTYVWQTDQGHKRRDWITHRQLCQRTGRASAAVSGAVDALVRAGLLVVEDAAGTPLGTPQARRRALGRLYYRAGMFRLSHRHGSSSVPSDT